MGTVLKGGYVVELEPALVERVDLRIEGERIVARGPDLTPGADDEVVALSGKLVFPGLVSAHHRLYAVLGRGMPRPPLESYQEILEQVAWPYENALDLDAVQVAGCAGGLEALQCGTTTVCDLHASPKAIAGSLTRLARGLHEVGVRGVLAYAVSDRQGALGREEGLEETVDFRAFFRGLGTVAEYFHNAQFTRVNDYHFTSSVNFNAKEGRAIRVGDRMELEVGVFLRQPVEGRFNYYATTYLYMVGSGGVVPFDVTGAIRDSIPMPEAGWSGGRTTLSSPQSNEPDNRFLQMANNLAPVSAQPFVEGRRIHHTHFGDGSHSEAGNPALTQHQGKLGPNYVAPSCVACHVQNGRGLPPGNNTTLTNYVVKVGQSNGAADPFLGFRLQPRRTSGTPEAEARISGWTTTSGTYGDGTSFQLRRPNYSFLNNTPTNFSARITPQLVGMGLLEAVAETTIAGLADPNDSNGDGISGRMHQVRDPQTGQTRLGRFGWKASTATVRHQVAEALNSDLGVTTSVFPSLDCGPSQQGCSGTSTELANAELDKLTRYISLLGVPARRGLGDGTVQRGETLFHNAGCARCHTATLTTSNFHPHAELRGQTIRPYTDLLLHDMGAGLADNLPDGQATGAEWRTPPLWGIGLTAGVSGGEAYLHDGRARNLAEAILWHGGEGQAARNNFANMNSADRNALLAFLRSL